MSVLNELQSKENCLKKELKINMQTDITVYLHHSYPLCIILSDEKLLEWYYEHYIQIYSKTDNNGYLMLDFLETAAPYREFTRQAFFGYGDMESVKDIIEFITKKIDSDCYLIIYADEYHLSPKERYKAFNYVHPSLIYGYDNEKKRLMAVGFNKEHLFTKLIYDYEEFIAAFESGRLHYREMVPYAQRSCVETIKALDFTGKYAFNLKRFLKSLGNYVCSKPDEYAVFCRMLEVDINNSEQVKYGLNVYNDIIFHFENLLKGEETMDYRAIHLLYEHKKGLGKRMKFIADKYKVSALLIELSDRYTEIVRQLEMARIIYLQESVSQGMEDGFFKPPRNKNTISKLIKLISTARDKEEGLLSAIYQQMKSELGNTEIEKEE